MSNEQAAAESDPDVTNLASALEVTKGIVAGVRPEQAHLSTPCTKYEVTQLLDHLVGFATHFADKANGVLQERNGSRLTFSSPRNVYRGTVARPAHSLLQIIEFSHRCSRSRRHF